MIFNSFTYLVLLAVAVALYWLMPRTARLCMLLAASVLFYGFWRFDFVPLLFASVITDYLAALVIGRSTAPGVRRAALVISIALNLSLLGFFKYFYFFADGVVGLGNVLGADLTVPAITILLPIGISFYTFQSMSYTIDVYRGLIQPCRDFLLFANYVTFFPQLVAGPILRAAEVTWQLDARPRFDPADVAIGLQRIISGLFLKVVLADNIASVVDEGFASDLSALSAIDVLTLAFLFGFQIYFDFAGYSHIAIGSARLMGIRFPENFNFPYSASSPREFWRRWHISLSSWIRDYLYLPLLGQPVRDRSVGGLPTRQTAANTRARALWALFATWAIMGLWHGAAWGFVVWGLWHALIVAGHRMATWVGIAIPAIFGWGITINLVMVGWIPFRAETLSDALLLWSHLLDPAQWAFLGLRENTYLVTAILLFGVSMAPFLHRGVDVLMLRDRIVWRGMESVALVGVLALVLVFLRPIEQFIYFQF